MTRASEQLMVAATLDRLAVGEQFDHLPAHCTIVPWFWLPAEKWEWFDAEMREVIVENRLSPTSGGDHVQFGEQGHVSARRLNQPDKFAVLDMSFVHAAVLGLALSVDATLDRTYTDAGEGYRPHISDTPGRSIDQGEPVVLDNLTVFHRPVGARTKVVKAMYRWEDAYDQATA